MVDRQTSQSRKLLKVILACITLALVLGIAWTYMSATPQLGKDPEVHKTLDALFTALTAKNPRQLAECKREIESQTGNGKIPSPAATVLRGHIADAERNEWEKAARGLYRFIQQQRTP